MIWDQCSSSGWTPNIYCTPKKMCILNYVVYNLLVNIPWFFVWGGNFLFSWTHLWKNSYRCACQNKPWFFKLNTLTKCLQACKWKIPMYYTVAILFSKKCTVYKHVRYKFNPSILKCHISTATLFMTQYSL